MNKQLLLISFLSLSCFATEPITEEQQQYNNLLEQYWINTKEYMLATDDDTLCTTSTCLAFNLAVQMNKKFLNATLDFIPHITPEAQAKIKTTETVIELKDASKSKFLNYIFPGFSHIHSNHKSRMADILTGSSSPEKNCDLLEHFYFLSQIYIGEYTDLKKEYADAITDKEKVEEVLEANKEGQRILFNFIKNHCSHLLNKNRQS